MMPMLLLLAGQALAAPEPAPDAPPKTPPSIYALVFVKKRPGAPSCSRKDQMIYEAAHCRYDREVLAIIVRADTIARLKIVKKQKDARAWLEKNLRVESLEDTGVLRISFADGSPAEQVAIVNAAANAYLQESNDGWRKRSENEIAQWSKDCANIREKVRLAEAQLSRLSNAKPKDVYEGERIMERRNSLARFVKEQREEWKKLETAICERQEYLRKPYAVLLESAELPPKAK